MSQAEIVDAAQYADEEIPILDIGPYLAGEPGALDDFATRLRHAQEDVGFYYIVNHGIAPGLIRQGYDNLRRFFDLPDEEKRKHSNYVPPKSTIYVSSTVNENTKPDLNEMLRIVRERPADHPAIRAGLRSHGPNHWPDEALVPGFRAAMLEYYEAMEALGRKLLPAYARALDLPAEYFDPHFVDPVWVTRNTHYPAVSAEDNQFGLAPHRDHGFLTLLPLSDEPGLEIRTQSGRWLPANLVEGGIIVNTGEFLSRWTNGRFLATPHRVVPPRHERYSIAFFFNPTWDTAADPLPTCTGPDNPPRFKPVRFLDYQNWYVDRNYLISQGETPSEPPSVEESTLKI